MVLETLPFNRIRLMESIALERYIHRPGVHLHGAAQLPDLEQNSKGASMD